MSISKLFITVFFLCTMLCCHKDNEIVENVDQAVAIDYLSFGHFYGECMHEQCVEIFLLKDGSLYEDQLDKYPSRMQIYEGDFILIDQRNVSAVMDLVESFPPKLLEAKERVFGCPDCADQGGLYLECETGGEKKYWIIDQNLNSIPAYLHEFVNKINDNIALINGS